MSGKSLLAFTAWTGVHIGLIVAYRGYSIFLKGRNITTFPSGKEHDGPQWYQRVMRSHANCLENLPLFACVVLVNKLFGKANLDSSADFYVLFRVFQSLIHWCSTNDIAINLRFAFFCSPMVIINQNGCQHLGNS